MVIIYEVGFQMVVIFMQSGELEKKELVINVLSDNVEDLLNKVEIDVLNQFFLIVGKIFYIDNECRIYFKYF